MQTFGHKFKASIYILYINIRKLIYFNLFSVSVAYISYAVLQVFSEIGLIFTKLYSLQYNEIVAFML